MVAPPTLNLRHIEVLKELQQDYRVPSPLSHPGKLYYNDIMFDCWQEEPETDPNLRLSRDN